MTWGNNAAGVPWQINRDYADDFEASAARGRIANPDTGVFRTAFMPYELTDVDLTVNVQTDQMAEGSWINSFIQARAVGEDNALSARIEFRDSGNYSISLYQIVDGEYSVLGTQVYGSYSASSPVMIRFQVTGDYARAKSWDHGSREPDHWQVGRTTTVLHPGRIGLGSVLSDGNTNDNPEVSWGRFRVANPQLFTVVRSVNGVVKPHDAGTAVSLAHPSVLAL